MSDTPKEMSLEMKWHDNHRVHIVLVNGDRTLHSDYCDPRSHASRKKAIDKLVEKFPVLEFDAIESELLQLARTGPPMPETTALTAVDGDPEPTADEVDGAELLDELVRLLLSYVILPAYAAEACALWVLHTYVYACFEYTPRLLIYSPEKRCGKSRLLRLIAALVSRALSCEGITSAVLFRAIDKYHPTLCLDEGDTYLSGREANEDIRAVLNSGHQRGGKVLRCVGDNSEPTAFSCFAPVAIAMIGKPAGTIEDRSIPVPMRRRLPGERVQRHPPGQSLRTQFIEFLQRCVRWANDNREALATAEPTVPTEIDDRAADCWFSLLAIADRAGGRWPALARQVAGGLMSARDSADGVGVQLLKDLRQIFLASDVDRMSSAGIVAELIKLEDRPWPEFRKGRPLTPNQLARLLRPFDVNPRTIRVPDGSTPKGYYKEDLQEAWARYLTPDPEAPPAPTATPPHTCDDKDLRQSEAATADQSVADENGHNPLSNKRCGGVAPPAGGSVQKIGIDEGSELAGLVSSMAEELDAPGVIAPFRGEDLRQFYERLVREDGVVAALTDARARYQRQVLGEVLPLRGVEQLGDGGGS